MMKSVGSSFKEVGLVKGEKWKPKSIFVVADILGIVKVFKSKPVDTSEGKFDQVEVYLKGDILAH
eukprot:15331612-Ditylum_brightwellii.AAC.1